MLAPQKESTFGCSCRLWLLSWRRARVFARSCYLLSKYLPISWKQRKEQSHAQCHVTHRIRIFDKISEHVKVAKSVDIAVPELAVTKYNRRATANKNATLEKRQLWGEKAKNGATSNQKQGKIPLILEMPSLVHCIPTTVTR